MRQTQLFLAQLYIHFHGFTVKMYSAPVKKLCPRRKPMQMLSVCLLALF